MGNGNLQSMEEVLSRLKVREGFSQLSSDGPGEGLAVNVNLACGYTDERNLVGWPR